MTNRKRRRQREGGDVNPGSPTTDAVHIMSKAQQIPKITDLFYTNNHKHKRRRRKRGSGCVCGGVM